MIRILIILILFVFVACVDKGQKDMEVKANEKIEIKSEKADIEDIDERLQKHFDLYRLTPSIEINNTAENYTEFQIGVHNFEWIDTDEETKIKINNDLFTLKDKTTLNIVSDRKDSVDFANYWDEIKLYKHNDKEYIGIKMLFSPCVGLGCSVAYFLIYDITTKSKNFFGTFKMDQNLDLYDFLNDDKIDYVSKTFNGYSYDSTPNEIIYERYSIDVNGEFKKLEDESDLTNPFTSINAQ